LARASSRQDSCLISWFLSVSLEWPVSGRRAIAPGCRALRRAAPGEGAWFCVGVRRRRAARRARAWRLARGALGAQRHRAPPILPALLGAGRQPHSPGGGGQRGGAGVGGRCLCGRTPPRGFAGVCAHQRAGGARAPAAGARRAKTRQRLGAQPARAAGGVLTAGGAHTRQTTTPTLTTGTSQ